VFAKEVKRDKSANEVLSAELFQRFLRVVQGLEGPREGLKATQKYKGLLVYFVLGGLQGLGTCEMIRERANDPVIEWRDFLWKKKLIVVRDEVAKQTRARDKLRYVPLEPATIKLLKPLATAGAMIPMADSTFYGMRRELCKAAGNPTRSSAETTRSDSWTRNVALVITRVRIPLGSPLL
jgi:integrase